MNLVLQKIHEIQERDLTKSLEEKLKKQQQQQQQQQQKQGIRNGLNCNSGSSNRTDDHQYDDDDDDDEYDDDLEIDVSSSSYGGGGSVVLGGDDDDDYKAEDDVQGTIRMTTSHSEQLLRKELEEIDKLLYRLSQLDTTTNTNKGTTTTDAVTVRTTSTTSDLKIDKTIPDTDTVTNNNDNDVGRTNSGDGGGCGVLAEEETVILQDSMKNNNNISSSTFTNTLLSKFLPFDDGNSTTVGQNNNNNEVVVARVKEEEEEAEISKEVNDLVRKKQTSSTAMKKKRQQQQEQQTERQQQKIKSTTTTTTTTTEEFRGPEMVVVNSTNYNKDNDINNTSGCYNECGGDCRDDDGVDPAAEDPGGDDGRRTSDKDDDDTNEDGRDHVFPSSIDCTTITTTFLACSDYLGVANCTGGTGATSTARAEDGDGDDYDYIVSHKNNDTHNKDTNKDTPATFKNLFLDSTDVRRFQVMANQTIDEMTQKAIAVCGSPQNETEHLGTPYSLKRKVDQNAINDLLLQENDTPADSSGKGCGGGGGDDCSNGDGDNEEEYIQQPTLSTISEHYSRENLSMSITPRDTNRTPSPVLLQPEQHPPKTTTPTSTSSNKDDVICNDVVKSQSNIADDDETKTALQPIDLQVIVTKDDHVSRPCCCSATSDDDATKNENPTKVDVVTPLPTNSSVQNVVLDLEPPAINHRPTASSGSDGNIDIIETPKHQKEEIVNLLEMPTLDSPHRSQQQQQQQQQQNRRIEDRVSETVDDLLDNDIPQISLKRRIRRPSEDNKGDGITSSTDDDNDGIIDGSSSHVKVSSSSEEEHATGCNVIISSYESEQSVEKSNKGTRNISGTGSTSNDTDGNNDDAIHHRTIEFDDIINEVPSDEGLSFDNPVLMKTRGSRNSVDGHRRNSRSRRDRGRPSSQSRLKVDTTTSTTTLKTTTTSSSSVTGRGTTTKSSKSSLLPPSSKSSSSIPYNMMLNNIEKYSPINAASSPRALFSAKYGSLKVSSPPSNSRTTSSSTTTTTTGVGGIWQQHQEQEEEVKED